LLTTVVNEMAVLVSSLMGAAEQEGEGEQQHAGQ
jgi:hypothetical protein